MTCKRIIVETMFRVVDRILIEEENVPEQDNFFCEINFTNFCETCGIKSTWSWKKIWLRNEMHVKIYFVKRLVGQWSSLSSCLTNCGLNSLCRGFKFQIPIELIGNNKWNLYWIFKKLVLKYLDWLWKIWKAWILRAEPRNLDLFVWN